MSENIQPVDSHNFDQKVLKSKTPVLVDFSADWCGWCKKMEPHLEKFSADRKGQISVMRLDTDNNPDIATKYNIEGLPTTILFQNGKEVGRNEGALLSPKEIAQWVDSTLSQTQSVSKAPSKGPAVPPPQEESWIEKGLEALEELWHEVVGPSSDSKSKQPPPDKKKQGAQR